MRFCPTCQRCFQAEIQFCLYDQTPTRDVRGVPLVLEGKYRLERLIAHGGMGSVYRGMHEQLERPVAVKILRAEFLQDETIRVRFHREALAAARLKHPNIIAVYDFGVLPDGGAYLVMELIEGRSLREEMRLNAQRNGQMRPERAAAIMRQICAGIEAAHQAGIIHRDLKPDNIMIEPLAAIDFSGSSERILVLDFGIAKLKQLEGAWQGLTDENVIIGTPNYISPEQCAGAAVEGRSDVYALGVILYEMLTGRVPFNNVSTSAVLLSHLQDAPLPPTKYRPDLPLAVERVMLRALAKNPQHRFGSASQLSDALTRALIVPQRPEALEVEDIWPDELPAVMPTPREQRQVMDEPATRPRQTRVAAPMYSFAEPSIPDGKIARRFVPRDESSAEEREVEAPEFSPEFAIAPQPRRGLWLLVGLLGLSAIAGLAWMADAPLPRSLRDRVAAWRGEAVTQPSVLVATSAPPVVPVAASPEAPITGASPTAVPSPVIDEAARTAALEKEVREFYRQWAQTALDQNWKAHAQTYAQQVDYYRDGLVARANVMTRKQRVLSGLQRTYLKFTTTPQVTVRERAGTPEAEITFDKTWDLLRGKDRSSGKAQTQLTLRRGADDVSWQIVSERQLRLYANALPPEAAVTAQLAKAKPTAVQAVARSAKKKQLERKPVRKAPTTRPRVAKPRIRP